MMMMEGALDLIMSLKVFVTVGVCVCLSFFVALWRQVSNAAGSSTRSKSAFLVVLGDIGRSPRMNYHCLSLAKHGYWVTIIGYQESKLMDEMTANGRIRVVALPAYPKFMQIGPGLVQYAIKAIFLTLSLVYALLSTMILPRFVLVQNPPSIPTLLVVYLYSKLTLSKFVIDWHNYGFSILALKSRPNSLLVRTCRFLELYFGKKADLNFCVTAAMKRDLLQYGINAVTAYDKPHERFKKMSLNQKHEFYLRLADRYNVAHIKESDQSTVFTSSGEDASGRVVAKPTRPILLVSSSSWTEDEDFQLLINAFEIYQKRIDALNESTKQPKIICILTGKGPLKAYYEQLFVEKRFDHIRVHFVWLDPDDYPLLLGSCDLGLCFHKSSSNLDLPMKVVDMFGARLPALCLDFSCISELVKENENGLLFSNEHQLADQLNTLFANSVADSPQLEKFRRNLNNFPSWPMEWDAKIEPLLRNL